MCGIAGILDLRSGTSRDALHDAARRMADAIQHRGPDAGDAWADPACPVALSHRRLSIIDLSPSGAQPMGTADGSAWIAFNGELYNFGELRRTLEAEGLGPWRGSSDTEVLLAACVAWGVERTLTVADGMFAFAFWHRPTRTLVLARDRFGEKPLYYGWQGQTLLFGSELRALRAHEAFEGAFDRVALHRMLHLSAVPSPMTAYLGIRQLPPGTFIRVALDTAAAGNLPEPVRFWDPIAEATRAAALPALSDDEALSEVDRLLARSVGSRLFSDVPLGSFLSGGIDSSLITAYAQAQTPARLHTFSIGFGDAEFDESEAASTIAAQLGTIHTPFRVTESDALGLVPSLPEMYDEPFADSSQIPTFLVAQLARRSVTVALTGDGGDELFGGYHRHIALPGLLRQQQRWPLAMRRGLRALVLATPPRMLDLLLTAAGPGRHYRHAGTLARKAADLLGASTPREAYDRLTDPWYGVTLLHDAAAPANGAWPFPADAAASAMALDTLHGLPDDMLTKVDRATMAVALECRAPFLEPELFRLGWRLRPEQRIRNGQGKWLLRTLLRRHLPASIVDAPKSGFAVPLGRWLRTSLRMWGDEMLEPSSLGRLGLIEAPIRARWAEHQRGRADHSRALWSVLMLVAWQRKWGNA